MDARRLILFVVLAVGFLFVWDKFFVPKNSIVASSQSQSSSQNQTTNNQSLGDVTSTLPNTELINVTTDLFKAQISTIGGDLRSVELLHYDSSTDENKSYQLLMNDENRTFVAQTGLLDSNNQFNLPTRNSIFTVDQLNYKLESDQNSILVNLYYTESSGIKVVKTYTFKRDSYQIGVSYKIINGTQHALTGVSAYWRLLRDNLAPGGEAKLIHTTTAPVYYTDQDKFNAIKFDKLANNEASYPSFTNNGWVGFIQHYFTAVWLLNPYGSNPVCSNLVQCRFSLTSAGNNLASAGILTDLPTISSNSQYDITVNLYAGPEEYNRIIATAPGLELTKDYGYTHLFATPLFWLLVKIQELVKNWGLAIILLTVLVKVVLFPLTNASYQSMGKMRALAPKIQRLKDQYGDDRVKMQSAMMELYKSEKVNPIGGCLPMILQIPVFIGLYWSLLASVELRQAGFLWIHDLSRPDPYYILPVILAVLMFLQTFLNPPPTDPVQAKIMKIMPIAFSVMFFFFPSGLVIYWLVNSLLTMAQQIYSNKKVHLSTEPKKR